MIILIDLSGLKGRRWTGIEKFGEQLLQSLRNRYPEANIRAIGYRENIKTRKVRGRIYVMTRRLLYEYFILPVIAAFSHFDLIIFPAFPPSWIYWLVVRKKTICVIHDIVPWKYPETMSRIARFLLPGRYCKALHYAFRILTTSGTERASLARISGRTDIIPIYNPLSSSVIAKDSPILERLGLDSGEYILTVSTLEPRKNIVRLLSIYKVCLSQGFSKKLVVVGRRGWMRRDDIAEIVRGLEEKLVFTEYVNDNDLSMLYKNCYYYICIPIHEGFGRTPLEARLNGASVVVSDIPVFRELLGDDATYLDLAQSDMELACTLISFQPDRRPTPSSYYKYVDRNYGLLLPDMKEWIRK